MNAEIIAVGSELLLGQITNTNAAFISKQLAELGVNVYFHTAVGDNPERLVEAIQQAEKRAELIIFSGGLGPTKDDLTKETIAKHLNTTLEMNEQAMQSIRHFFEKIHREMTPNNEKQALVLKGSFILENHHGMAPGMVTEHQNRFYMLLPGPPKELEPMFQFEAKPFLMNKLFEDAAIYSHVLRFYGIGEAELEDRIHDILDAQSNPTIAPLASDGEVTIRISAKSKSKEEADSLIYSVEEKIVERVGDYLYGYNDDSLASKAVDALRQHEMTIAAAESLTAGLFMAELASVPAVSDIFVGGEVTYHTDAKINTLGVSREIIENYGVVSKECAIEMAKKASEKFGTKIGVGLTGAAGPSSLEGETPGSVWIGIRLANGETYAEHLQLSGNRNTNRLRVVKKTFSILIRLVKDSTIR
ncbi:competence/damage-inducible protein A [Paenisporosarcina cavernae]|uniref:Putative competence-damage inducible protein n=1 Tax=Paenisporosarcina cavernae TaxID=2320858 RepID=A0A385YS26_9BACL|nr:competence/damage-inducible protein A [Paenisporosarcina cavernae]AYC29304.1 competence/damage-inducible protein A [Paenisporosarcina cavernae]